MARPVQSERRRSPIAAPVIVGVLVAIIAGSSAPWWLSELIGSDGDGTTVTDRGPAGPEATSAAPPTPTPTPSPDTTSDTEPTTEPTTTEPPPEGCVITVVNPLVTMYEEPDAFGPQVGRLPTGQHRVLEWRLVAFAGSDDRWFRVSADGRTGWIMDSTILIDAKSADCP